MNLNFHKGKILFLYILFINNVILTSSISDFNKQNSCSRFSISQLQSLSKCIVPPLDGTKKGDLGKIGIIGGSTEYTGAPYFAAISAYKVGADLVYVITTEDAAPIIKSYSPDLIVYPYLNKRYASKINSLLQKMDTIVIGPGLGREEDTIKLIYEIIDSCKTLSKPLVIDADGLFAVSQNISVLTDYPKPGVILTPNHREAKHLIDAVLTNQTKWYSYWGQYVSVLIKGETDIFNSSSSAFDWFSSNGGSGRRAGGQGDILSGALGTFYYWALKSKVDIDHDSQFAQSVAAYAAAKFTRICNSRAYELFGRSMLASDMIQEIHKAFNLFFSD